MLFRSATAPCTNRPTPLRDGGKNERWLRPVLDRHQSALRRTRAWVLTLTPGEETAIRAAMEDYMSRRREKQPLEYGSAGSTFKRPVGNYASALVDQCGLKGLSVGGAEVSQKHAGFIINRGGATAADVRQLIAEVQRIVREKTGYTLECEIKYIE